MDPAALRSTSAHVIVEPAALDGAEVVDLGLRDLERGIDRRAPPLGAEARCHHHAPKAGVERREGDDLGSGDRPLAASAVPIARAWPR